MLGILLGGSGGAGNAMPVLWPRNSLFQDVKSYPEGNPASKGLKSSLQSQVFFSLPLVYLISRAFINSFKNRYGNPMCIWYINTHLSPYI